MSDLELDAVNSFYGKSHVLFDVSMEVPDGDVVALIGRNGAGKSTTLRTIMGMITPRSGQIRFGGRDVAGLSPFEVSHSGISLIPEQRRVFSNLTVAENLKLGALGHDIEDDFDDRLDTVFEYFPRLQERFTQKGGQMSGGEQQMLAIGRALMSDPDLLLLDEVTEGLMPTLVTELRETLARMNDNGIGLLIVEQNVGLALDLSDYGYILNKGRIEAAGDSRSLLEDEEIKERYLAI